MRYTLKKKSFNSIIIIALIIIIFSICIIFFQMLFLQNIGKNSKIYIRDSERVKASETTIPLKQLALNSNINKGSLEKNIQEVDKIPSDKKTVYLTFDDGPSTDTTPQIIGILNKYNIKATFFVIGQYAAIHPEILKLQISEGFVVANHTYSHNIDYLYLDPKNLVSDFEKNEILLKTILPGYNSKLVRFPGGSRQRDKRFITAVKKEGYKIVDWNCLSKDAEKPYTAEELFNNVKNTSKGKNNLIILMHDSAGRQNTVEALPKIIEYLKQQEYNFEI